MRKMRDVAMLLLVYRLLWDVVIFCALVKIGNRQLRRDTGNSNLVEKVAE
jgi:hypothetical protein